MDEPLEGVSGDFEGESSPWVVDLSSSLLLRRPDPDMMFKLGLRGVFEVKLVAGKSLLGPDLEIGGAIGEMADLL